MDHKECQRATLWAAERCLPRNPFAHRPTTGLFLLFFLSALASACGSPNDGFIVLQDENNYRSTASLSVPTVETASATDLDICWTNTTSDLLCHQVLPATDIENVGLLRLRNLTQPQIEAKLVSGTLAMANVDGYVQYSTDPVTTCMKLSQFSFFGTAADVATLYVASTVRTYLLVFAHGMQPGVGARAMTFIKPTATSTNTRVDAPAGCGLIDFTADLSGLKHVVVSTNGPWTVDWGKVTTNGQGDSVAYTSIDRLLVGFYQGMTVADLQAKFFDIELLATSLWDLSVKGGHTAELGQAVERGSGALFPGFARTDGIWMLALLCSTCQNPAPVALTILDPGAGGR
jgi:hypothetical protein